LVRSPDLSSIVVFIFAVCRIQAASQVQGDAVKLNRMIERQGKVDVELVKKIMQHKVGHQV
jgi:hypothetical protein